MAFIPTFLRISYYMEKSWLLVADLEFKYTYKVFPYGNNQ